MSPPVAEITGLFPAAALAIVISFVAEAVWVNKSCSFALASIIPYVLATTIFFEFVLKFAASVGAKSLDNFPMLESTTSVPFKYKIFVPLSVAEKVTPVWPWTNIVTVNAPDVLFLIT